MSALKKNHITFYEAPLGISSTRVTIEGSWSPSQFVGHMSTTPLIQMRLHTWKQQSTQSKVSTVCLDWVMINVNSTTKNILMLKLSDKTFAAYLQEETFMQYIQKILDNANIYNVHNSINNYSQVT